MSSYKYSLYDYHAVGQADIELEGITVLAGDNGCGKSTLSQWLYYLVNTSTSFDELLFRELQEQLDGILRQGRTISREIDRVSQGFSSSDFIELCTAILTTRYMQEDSVSRIMQIYEDAIRLLGKGLSDYLSGTKSEFRIQRMNRILNLGTQYENDPKASIDYYVENRLKEAEAYLSEYHQHMEERSMEHFFDLIHNTYHVQDKEPERIQLSEDGVKLLRKNGLGSLLSLDRAIYVDTPMALSFGNPYSDSPFWHDLRSMMKSSPVAQTSSAQKILLRIKRLLGGEVKVQNSVYQGKELRFVRQADNLDIRLEDVATGMKTFAYVQKLVENGYLNDKTLLLIDEPEAHLHPKWIFEFAHLMVLLYKELGVKLMIASHNPDMVAALQKISQIEGVIDATHFYQAYPQEGRFRFVYKDLGGSITEIFRSFNIATSRIQDYGESGK